MRTRQNGVVDFMDIVVRNLGLTDYRQTFAAMKAFTADRDDDSTDALWLTEHYPVFTQGQAGRAEHLLVPGDIPVVQSDRGGQVTYHGPGQVVVYFLLDIKRASLGVRQMVDIVEQSVINTLTIYGVDGFSQGGAPGVYVAVAGESRKIASLGLRVSKGRSYHGVALNVDMDLSPFERINPCGYRELRMTQLSDLTNCNPIAVAQQLTEQARELLTQFSRTGT